MAGSNIMPRVEHGYGFVSFKYRSRLVSRTFSIAELRQARHRALSHDAESITSCVPVSSPLAGRRVATSLSPPPDFPEVLSWPLHDHFQFACVDLTGLA